MLRNVYLLGIPLKELVFVRHYLRYQSFRVYQKKENRGRNWEGICPWKRVAIGSKLQASPFCHQFFAYHGDLTRINSNQTMANSQVDKGIVIILLLLLFFCPAQILSPYPQSTRLVNCLNEMLILPFSRASDEQFSIPILTQKVFWQNIGGNKQRRNFE